MVKVIDISNISNLTSNSYNLSVQPNPFSNTTQIIFTLPKDETVNIMIYDLLGKAVKSFSGNYSAGDHQLQWNGDDNNGSPLSEGMYHIRMTVAGNEQQSRKVMLIK